MENSNSFPQSPQPGIFADKKLIILMIGAVLLVLFFVFLAFVTLSAKPNKPLTVKTVITPTPVIIKNINQIQPGKTKLSETVYGSFAHKVFPGPMSAKDQERFKNYSFITTPNQDGSTTITASFPIKGYAPIVVVIQPSETAYFVEPEPREDVGDDFIIITDKNGNIVER